MPKAFYVKLGAAGAWERDAIANSIVRIGWVGQRIDDINAERWEVIEKQLRAVGGPKGTATNDLNRLRDFARSTPDDLWVTFHQSKLWWTRMLSTHVEEDSVSKFRRTQPWRDASETGRQLFINELPGGACRAARISRNDLQLCRD